MEIKTKELRSAMIDPIEQYKLLQTRRHFLQGGTLGLGSAALASLMQPGSVRAGTVEQGGLPELPHFAPKAKRAIYLFMSGGPSQIDMYDYKPKLNDLFDSDLPESIRNGQRLTTMTSGQTRFPIAPSKYKFEKFDNGGDGMWVSELLPHTAKVVKEMAFIRSVHTEAINHDPAITYFCTGDQLPGKPSLGAWLGYGLGSENENLPAFVVMTPSWSAKRDAQALYNRLWGSGFLPSKHQGVLLRTQGDPVLYLTNPDGVSAEMRKQMLDTVVEMNHATAELYGDPETQARIAQYEMAYRMQTSIPEFMDLSTETAATLEKYGPDVHKPGTFAYCALLARRLAERDVRFIQLFHRDWDQHGNIAGDLAGQCRDIDQPIYAFLTDLRERGMLDDTLVIWGGEFGRTVYCQGDLTRENYGRDHHPRCFTMWMAGAGIQGGVVHGETDDFSYNVTRDPVHIHDINATILHLMGIQHDRFTVKYQGLDQRLTGVQFLAKPVEAILS